MPFPEKGRVIYKKNPLAKVICQLRYPPILKIDSDVPSGFQELIRSKYPLYNEKIQLQQEMATGLKTQSPPQIIRRLTKTSVNKNHEFGSSDNLWKINLTRTFLSLSTTEYPRWEDFIDKFQPSIDALKKVYEPPFFTRIGLRYVDIFDRSELALNDCEWTDLFQPYFLGLLASSVAQEIKSFENSYEINLSDDASIVRIATSFAQNAKTGENCYMVDSDFYTPGRTAIDALVEKLEFLHERATRLIQWMITEKLRNAMEPEEI